ncbi:MAG: prolyl oligopeptidase family serine peptidase [Ilumatobacteraceae bacterium]
MPEDASGGTVLVSGSDFYSNPRLSPDGNHLAWLSWNHPNMPWDGCTLWEAEILPNGWLGKPEAVAGGAGESIFQPTYSPDGDLWVVSDRTGWWNLYRRRNGVIEAIAPSEQEFGEPAWVFGMTTYAFVDADTVLAGHTTEDGWALSRIDTRTFGRTQVPVPYSGGDGIDAHDGRVIMLGTSATKPGEIALIDPASGAATSLRVASAVTLDPAWISIAETFAFPTEGGLTAYALRSMPNHPEFSAPEVELPPLLVQSDCGPTAGTSTSFDPTVLYWTSRGFCVLDVDYGGSTGYGRAYRERLNGQWGIVDVDDCVNGARRLIEMGVVDPNRTAVRGWSASGYLTLAALTFRDVFSAGVSHFGISDLETMAADTHKFDSRYLDGLLGPDPAAKQTYVERSPIHYVEQVTVPLALFQGGEDKIVPPDQAELMYEAVKARGIPTALVIFPEEGHGFRAAENIRVATEGELYFYGQVFGFTPHGEIATIEIANL